nr:hypothetical protein [uncultured Desulfobulbus sp.]
MIKIIKIGHCPSLSGRTSLTYRIGRKEQKVYIQLHENSNGGFFCKEWITLEEMGVEDQRLISSDSIQANFKGKSANTGGFLLAVLLREGLVQAVERHTYRCCDPGAFIQEVLK